MEGLHWRMDVQSAEPLLSFGRKRRAEEELENDQRLAKRFNLLNIEQSGRLYFPVEHSPPKGKGEACQANDNDLMELENTREKVYIHNLDQELSEIESEGERLIFLPDIEKKLARIPNSVLTGQSQPVISNEVVLYKVPSSLSIPREEDNVRRAILEARARVLEKQAQEVREAQIHAEMGRLANGISYHGHLTDYGTGFSIAAADEDENAMDIG